MEEFIVSSSRNIAYSPKLGGVAVSMEANPPAAKTTSGIITGQTNQEGIKVAYWGDDNDFPGMIKKILNRDAELTKLIDWKVRISMGKGIRPLNEIDVDNNGNPIYEAIKDPEILRWFRSPQIRKYILEGFIDVYTFFNVWPELIPTKDRSRIHGIYVNEAMHCRWAQMGEDGRLAKVIHNKNWPSAKLDNPKETTIIPALDPYDYDLVRKVKDDKSLTKFIYPVSYPTIGQTYYQLAHWDGLRTSGWLDIAAKIPEFKAALLKNQMTIKYLIRIPNHYWPSRFPKWSDMDAKAQTAAKRQVMDEINKTLTDVENTGKSLLNEVGFDPVTKDKLPGWEIEVIDDKTKTGAFLEDSQEASSHKMRALGLDNALVGSLITGKGMGSGSGSDKQLSWNIFISVIDAYRQIILDPLMFAAQFNGWTDTYPGFTLKFIDTIMETVNGHNQQKSEGAN